MTNELTGLDILLVDDDDDGRELCEFVFMERGARVHAAASAAAAMRVLATVRPSILACDISLPDEDGYAFLARVRALDADLPAIALTGHTSREDVERARGAGYQQHFAKPLRLEDLVAAVGRLARRGPAGA